MPWPSRRSASSGPAIAARAAIAVRMVSSATRRIASPCPVMGGDHPVEAVAHASATYAAPALPRGGGSPAATTQEIDRRSQLYEWIVGGIDAVDARERVEDDALELRIDGVRVVAEGDGVGLQRLSALAARRRGRGVV